MKLNMNKSTYKLYKCEIVNITIKAQLYKNFLEFYILIKNIF